MNILLKVLVAQLSRPHGPLGHVVASLLDRGNHATNLHTIAALELRPGQRVLEIGFGGGVGLAMALSHEPALALSGIEISEDMVERCNRRFEGRARVSLGSADSIPAAEAAFDKVYGVNVAYFWKNLNESLAEIRRVLAPEGMLILGVRPKEILEKLDFAAAGHRVWTPEQYGEALQEAGFQGVVVRRVPDPNGAYLVLGRRA